MRAILPPFASFYVRYVLAVADNDDARIGNIPSRRRYKLCAAVDHLEVVDVRRE